MARDKAAEKIGGRYIRISRGTDARCLDTDLGQVCKAYDTSNDAASGARYVSLTLLHDWFALLPGETLQDLDAAIAALTEPKPRQPERCAMQSILDARLPGAGTQPDHYLTSAWVEPLTPPNTLFARIGSAEQAVRFVADLAKELATVYNGSPFVRPAIGIERLAYKPGAETIILNDLGIERVLDRVPRTPDLEQKDVELLRDLLLQLLDGIALSATSPVTDLQLLHKLLPEVEDRWRARSLASMATAMGELWQVLGSNTYDHLAGFEVALRECLPHLPTTIIQPETTTILRKTEDLPPTSRKPVLNDHLVLRFLEGTSEIVLTQRLDDEIVLLGADQGLEFTDESRLTFAGNEDAIARLVEFRVLLRQRRVYIQRHGSSDTRYYTITDFEPATRDSCTRLDGHPLSPLFAALLTPKSIIETANGFRAELLTTGLSRSDGWIGAQMQRLAALKLPVSAVVETGATSIAVPIEVNNPTERVERLTLFVDGMPPDWPPAQPVTVPLFENESAKRSFALNVPPLRLAGEYVLTVRLISDNVSAEVAAESFRLVVPQEFHFSGEFQPEIVRTGEAGALHLINDGNFTRTFTIVLRDRAHALRFEPSQTSVSLPPYTAGVIHFRAWSVSKRRRLIGNDKSHDISAVVAPAAQHHGAAQEFPGQVISSPLIPLWLPLAFALLFAGLILLYSLVAVPTFQTRALTVAGTPVKNAIAGSPLTLKWEGSNTCFYRLSRNDVEVIPRTWGTSGEVTRSDLEAGDQLELQLTNCSLMQSARWPIEVAAAPTPAPSPPVIAAFTLHTQNVESAGTGTGGAEGGTPPENQQILLKGQTGNLCIRWALSAPVDQATHALRIVTEPALAPITQDAQITEPTGEKCFPIASTFVDVNQDYQQPLVYYLRIGTTDRLTGQESLSSETKIVQVYQPICTVNATGPLLLREGPGRSFPERGQLTAGERVFPMTRPLLLREQEEALHWVQATLVDDPRPVWVATEYLYCPVPIDVLPAASVIPPTPTPTPSPTPTPTPQPTAPPPQPVFKIEPPIVNAGGCAMVTWAIQNVNQVFLNGEGVVGVSQRQVCPSAPGEYVYTWLIVANNGSKAEKSLTLLVNGSPVPPPPSE